MTHNKTQFKAVAAITTGLITLLALTGCQLEQNASPKNTQGPVLVTTTEQPAVEAPPVAEQPAPEPPAPEPAPAPVVEVPAAEPLPPAPAAEPNCVDNSESVSADGGMQISVNINCSLGN
ncbi:cell division protein FtsN [Aurantimicrobium minutum]|uniref:hypothetical protein n=1 Tax=Aurantimicrobium minutum TaxID=708131 RepID=UPI002474BDD2|nr:hypothetical protein [Aurantimicrobium minutum]MDH6532374.1 cell division protein FtsN [Aurantimicrobium minutum]